MADGSKISWLKDSSGMQGATWNIVRGCTRASPGCENCYAESMAHRFNRPGYWADGLTVIRQGRPGWSGKLTFVEEKLEEPLRWRRPRRIFVCSGADLFHDKVPKAWLDRVWDVMRRADKHTFMVLTKRHENMLAYLSEHQQDPAPNVWVGVSVENQEYADLRIPELMKCPAAVRYLSAEPLIGPVDLRITEHESPLDGKRLDWVIAGGESGPRARPCALEWLESIMYQCVKAGAAPFIKQLGAYVVSEERAAPTVEEASNLLGHEAQYRWLWRAGLQDRKGENPDEWPEDLRVRTYPGDLLPEHLRLN